MKAMARQKLTLCWSGDAAGCRHEVRQYRHIDFAGLSGFVFLFVWAWVVMS
jgi:hypothetical protein